MIHFNVILYHACFWIRACFLCMAYSSVPAQGKGFLGSPEGGDGGYTGREACCIPRSGTHPSRTTVPTLRVERSNRFGGAKGLENPTQEFQ